MTTESTLPVIQQALGDQWEQLADIIKQHYAISPGSDTQMTINGHMDEVYHSNIAKLFLLPGRLFGALVPYKGKNIATEVRNWTTTDNNSAMFWHRTLLFPGKQPVIFKSRMEHIQKNEIIEFVKYGMGIRMQMSVEENALVFKSIGYTWKLGSLHLPIPNWMILGDATIIEKALSDEQFHIDFQIIHPLLGRTFSYGGIFEITENR